MKLASRASRPGLPVGFLRILFNGLCTAQRFHVEGEAQMCRIGSLSHYNECPLLYNLFASTWRHATALPRRGHLFRDLITQVFLRSLQYGIVVRGLIDAFVYAHNHHRRNIENLGNFGDYMKGRIRVMTAITPACAHAYQVTCLAAVPSQKFRLPAAKARYPHLTNARTATPRKRQRLSGMGRPTLTEVLALLMVKHLLDGLHDLPTEEQILCLVLVITTEAHLAFAGARVHSNKTAEMSAMVEALSFLWPHGPVVRDANSCVFL